MKKLWLIPIACGVCGVLLLWENKPRVEPGYSIGDEENPQARDEYEFLVQRDPATNTIPRNIRRLELQFAKKIPTREKFALAKGTSVQPISWTERGPTNVGGRTRTFAADVAHVGTLIAGGVDGGIWKSTNDGASWKLTLSPEQIHSTSCIAQDTRPGHTNIWYVGTGEFRGSTTNDTRWGSFYNGDGIYKSTNNGDSWTLLPSTTSGTPQTNDTFDFTWNIATNPADPDSDEVYAATWRGIYRSADGGKTWNVAKPSDEALVNSARGTTEIVVTSTGVIYAHTRESGAQKIWRSTNGVTWSNITPANFSVSPGKIAFGTTPSNPKVLYLFLSLADVEPEINAHQLWKFTYSDIGGVWENRSLQLPATIDTQSGYDLIIHVKPDDENVIILGGTNLYRSTDGFASPSNTAIIGGYNFWPGGNHHPDMQSGMFKPTNSKVYYSGNDGGVQRADSIMMSGTMVWTSLNNGYNVTQFYSVSISPDSGDAAIVAGAQDNGTQFTETPGIAPWEMITGGDGTIAELAPKSDDRVYTQSQSGPLYRQTRAGTGYVTMNPSGAVKQMFVNPIALDPNNSKILYYGGGKSGVVTSGVWRNDDAPNGTATTGWTAIVPSDVGGGRTVSAIGVSRANAPNVVYYGTTDGMVRRMDSAVSASPAVIDVTPPGMNGGTSLGGFVRCVAVDPRNSRIALVAFGNYNFKNLWFTTNGGTQWTDVEGNLAGPGGPSVRWATILYSENQRQVFLATSIGVLMTSELKGDSTLWVQAAANEIGNVLISYLDFRESDGTLAVATHGRGVFTTQLPSTTTVGVPLAKNILPHFALEQNYPNPFNPTTHLRFAIPARPAGGSNLQFVTLRVYDMLGREISTPVSEQMQAGEYTVEFDGGGLASGVYIYRLRAGDFVETRKMILAR